MGFSSPAPAYAGVAAAARTGVRAVAGQDAGVEVAARMRACGAPGGGSLAAARRMAPAVAEPGITAGGAASPSSSFSPSPPSSSFSNL